MFVAFTAIILIKDDKFVVADYQAPLKRSANQIREQHPDTKKLLIIDALSSGIDFVSIQYYLGPVYHSRVSGLTWKPNGIPLLELRNILARYDDVFIHSAPESMLQAIAKIKRENRM